MNQTVWSCIISADDMSSRDDMETGHDIGDGIGDDGDDKNDDDDDVVVVERALSHLSAQPTLPPLCGATGGQTTLHTACSTLLEAHCKMHSAALGSAL